MSVGADPRPLAVCLMGPTAAGKTARDKLATMRSSLKEREGSFREAVITANTLPPDRYQAADRADDPCWIGLQ